MKLLGVVLALALVGCSGAVSAATDDDAFIHALTAGPGVRADAAFVSSHSREDLILSGHDACTFLSMEGPIQTMHDLTGPPYGFNGREATAVLHAAREVYCP